MDEHRRERSARGETLHVDCDSCAARGPACDDCVVSVLLGPPGATIDLDASDQAALAALADSGMVPPLRLIPGHGRRGPSRRAGSGRNPDDPSRLRRQPGPPPAM